MWKKGGNVVDAFVSASFVISVVRPHSTGLLGGGFAVVHFKNKSGGRAFDFRERAPLGAEANVFLDPDGNPIPKKSVLGPWSAAVPGMVFGLLSIQRKYGRLPLEEVLEPAIQASENGFAVYEDLAKSIQTNWEHMNPEMKVVFGRDGKPLLRGEALVQKDLGSAIRRIAKNGESELRTGDTAKFILAYFLKANEWITKNDLERYEVLESEPLVSQAFGKRVLTMPPPSSAVHLLTMVHVWEQLNQKKNFLDGELGDIVKLTESMRLGFRDRAILGGDPRFTKIDVEHLLSTPYAEEEALEIQKKVVSGAWPNHSDATKKESYNTTHISVLDREGNAVSSTQSINGSLGAVQLVPGTGLVLNNTMDDFTLALGKPNLYGLVGTKANFIAPGKTPLSSMSPMVFLDDKNRADLVIGAPGGSQIPTTIFNTLYRYLIENRSLYESAAFPRLHHQYQPDILFVEPEAKNGFPESKLPFYRVQYNRHRAKVFVVAREGNELIGVSDPRGEGIPLGF